MLVAFTCIQLYPIWEAKSEPVTTQSRSSDTRQGQDAYERLLRAIKDARLKPGDRIVETELASSLGLSRTPIREAIRQLESDGLVTHQPRIGATVRTLDYSEVNELYEMRAVLEGTAARLAARGASDIEMSELDAIIEDMTRTSDTVRLSELNGLFHGVILNAARNRFLVKSVNAVQKTLLILGPSTLSDEARARDANHEHKAVVEALRARDGDAAEERMRAHIERAHRARLQLLRTERMP